MVSPFSPQREVSLRLRKENLTTNSRGSDLPCPASSAAFPRLCSLGPVLTPLKSPPRRCCWSPTSSIPFFLSRGASPNLVWGDSLPCPTGVAGRGGNQVGFSGKGHPLPDTRTPSPLLLALGL